ncbi:MAG: hypothetical protein ACOCT9_01625 [archaeon]
MKWWIYIPFFLLIAVLIVDLIADLWPDKETKEIDLYYKRSDKND